MALVLLAALSLFIVFSPLATALRHAVFDGYQRLFPLEGGRSPVRVVLIDEDTIATVGAWPWPRTRMAELVERIAGHDPVAIGLDLIFPEPDRFSPAAIAAELPLVPEAIAQLLEALPSNDERFAAAIRGRGVVLGIVGERAFDARFAQPPRAAPAFLAGGIEETLESYRGHVGNVAPLERAAAGRGLLNAGPLDQVVRRVPIVAQVQGVTVPALGVELYRVALQEPLRVSRLDGGLAQAAVGRSRIGMQDDGHAWLRFSRHTKDFTLSAADVLAGRVDPEALRDSVVLVGVSGLGVLDHKTTALRDFIPGVYVHAQVVENLFNGESLARPDWAPRAEAAVLVLCGLILVLFVPRLSALQGINLAIGLVVLLAGAGFVAFLHFATLLDPAWPAIGTMAVFGSVVVGTLSEAERQRRQLREQAAHMAGEVDAARRIQMGLLPDPETTLAHDRRFTLAAALEPARTVGGDFYDCFMVDARRLFFVVADVSGKGLPAALFMAAAKSHIKSAALREREVGEVLSRAQDEIARENPEQLFVTAFAAVLDVQTGVLEYANAGHEPPFRRRPEGAPERMGPPLGPPLCVVEDFEHPTARLELVPGEWLVVVTDGVTEAQNPAREFFGIERLRASLSWLPREAQPGEVVRRIEEDVLKFAAGAEQADDLTLLALCWRGRRA